MDSPTTTPLAEEIERRVAAIGQKLVAWRRDLHRNPELGNREFRTSGRVAAHLKALGLEVQEKVAHTGVVGLLRGARPDLLAQVLATHSAN